MLHTPPTNLLLLAAKQETYKKAYLLTKNIEEFSGKSLEERTTRQKKIRQKGYRTRQTNKRGVSKVESNDSPEIPDRGGDIGHPRPPFGGNMSDIFFGPKLMKTRSKQTNNFAAWPIILHENY